MRYLSLSGSYSCHPVPQEAATSQCSSWLLYSGGRKEEELELDYFSNHLEKGESLGLQGEGTGL